MQINEKYVRDILGDVGMHLSLYAQKLQNTTEKIQLRIMCATFNGNPCIAIISYYSPINVINEIYIRTFCNELS